MDTAFSFIFSEGFSFGCTVRLLLEPIFILRLLGGQLSLSVLGQLQGWHLSQCDLASASSFGIETLYPHSFILNLNKLTSIFLFSCTLFSPVCFNFSL